MLDQRDSETTLLMTILQEPNADKARRRYLKAFTFDEIDDQAIYDLVEERVFDAIMRKGPVVQIERELAQTMLLLLKKGIRRSRGGQRNTRHQKLSKRTLIELAGTLRLNSLQAE